MKDKNKFDAFVVDVLGILAIFAIHGRTIEFKAETWGRMVSKLSDIDEESPAYLKALKIAFEGKMINASMTKELIDLLKDIKSGQKYYLAEPIIKEHIANKTIKLNLVSPKLKSAVEKFRSSKGESEDLSTFIKDVSTFAKANDYEGFTEVSRRKNFNKMVGDRFKDTKTEARGDIKPVLTYALKKGDFSQFEEMVSNVRLYLRKDTDFADEIFERKDVINAPLSTFRKIFEILKTHLGDAAVHALSKSILNDGMDKEKTKFILETIQVGIERNPQGRARWGERKQDLIMIMEIIKEDGYGYFEKYILRSLGSGNSLFKTGSSDEKAVEIFDSLNLDQRKAIIEMYNKKMITSGSIYQIVKKLTSKELSELFPNGVEGAQYWVKSQIKNTDYLYNYITSTLLKKEIVDAIDPNSGRDVTKKRRM